MTILTTILLVLATLINITFGIVLFLGESTLKNKIAYAVVVIGLTLLHPIFSLIIMAIILLKGNSILNEIENSFTITDKK